MVSLVKSNTERLKSNPDCCYVKSFVPRLVPMPFFLSLHRLERFIVRATLMMLICVIGLWGAGVLNAPKKIPTFPHRQITLHRADGSTVPYTVEVATTESQKEYGLMFRHEPLPRDTGMLFLWDDEKIVNMWMKNTFIPLDMLFVGSDGAIVKILRNTEPLSLNILSSDQPVRAVIELNAGEVKRLDVQVGDKIPGLYSLAVSSENHGIEQRPFLVKRLLGAVDFAMSVA